MKSGTGEQPTEDVKETTQDKVTLDKLVASDAESYALYKNIYMLADKVHKYKISPDSIKDYSTAAKGVYEPLMSLIGKNSDLKTRLDLGLTNTVIKDQIDNGKCSKETLETLTVYADAALAFEWTSLKPHASDKNYKSAAASIMINPNMADASGKLASSGSYTASSGLAKLIRDIGVQKEDSDLSKVDTYYNRIREVTPLDSTMGDEQKKALNDILDAGAKAYVSVVNTLDKNYKTQLQEAILEKMKEHYDKSMDGVDNDHTKNVIGGMEAAPGLVAMLSPYYQKR